MRRQVFTIVLTVFIFCYATPYIAQAQVDEPDDTVVETVITVSSAATPEQLLFGHMLQILLEQAGYTVIDKIGVDDIDVVRTAMENGEADVYIAQIGDTLIRSHQLPAMAIPSAPERAHALAAALDQLRELVWLDYGTVNNSLTLLVNQDLAGAGINTIPALAKAVNADAARFVLCAATTFLESEEGGVVSLQQSYGFQFNAVNLIAIASDDIYDALQTGQCNVGLGQRIDRRIATGELVPLVDPLAFFPIQVVAPVIRSSVLDANPELRTLLTSFLPHLDNDTLSQLHARILLGADGIVATGDEETPATVAYTFLNGVGLAKNPTVRVGSHAYTENLILGELAAQMLQHGGFTVERNAGIPDALTLRSAMENGEIDVYVELIGCALTLFHELPASALPADPDRALALARSLDEPEGIAWLDRSPFNDTFAMMVRPELIDLGIRSIADLGQYMNENDAPFNICVETDFLGRELDGLAAMEERHDFRFKPENVLLMDYDGLYEAVRAGECDIAEGYSTDGRIAAWELFSIEDTLAFFPFFNASPLVRQEVLDIHPEMADLLNSFLPFLDDATMSLLNARVDIGSDGLFASGDEQTPEEVAADFLQEIGLLSADNITGTITDTIGVTIGVTTSITTASAEIAATQPLSTVEVSTLTQSITESQVSTVIVPITATVVSTPTVLQQPSTPIVIEIFIAVNNGVNARAAPSLDAAIIGGFPRGTTVRAVGRTEDSSWLQVELGEDELAWVFTGVVAADPDLVETLQIIP